jgi:hypothetical protein
MGKNMHTQGKRVAENADQVLLDPHFTTISFRLIKYMNMIITAKNAKSM